MLSKKREGATDGSFLKIFLAVLFHAIGDGNAMSRPLKNLVKSILHTYTITKGHITGLLKWEGGSL